MISAITIINRRKDSIMENPNVSVQIVSWLTPMPGWETQPDEYYAAHFLVGSGLIAGNAKADEGKVRSLAAQFRKMYETGVEHGRLAEQRGTIQLAPAA